MFLDLILIQCRFRKTTHVGRKGEGGNKSPKGRKMGKHRVGTCLSNNKIEQ